MQLNIVCTACGKGGVSDTALLTYASRCGSCGSPDLDLDLRSTADASAKSLDEQHGSGRDFAGTKVTHPDDPSKSGSVSSHSVMTGSDGSRSLRVDWDDGTSSRHDPATLHEAALRSTASRRTAISTPWGQSDYEAQVAPGVMVVGTPSHGGIKTSPAVTAEVESWLTVHGYDVDAIEAYAPRGWWEEDIAQSAVMAAHPEWFNGPNSPFPGMRGKSNTEIFQDATARLNQYYGPDTTASRRTAAPRTGPNGDRYRWDQDHNTNRVEHDYKFGPGTVEPGTEALYDDGSGMVVVHWDDGDKTFESLDNLNEIPGGNTTASRRTADVNAGDLIPERLVGKRVELPGTAGGMGDDYSGVVTAVGVGDNGDRVEVTRDDGSGFQTDPSGLVVVGTTASRRTADLKPHNDLDPSVAYSVLLAISPQAFGQSVDDGGATVSRFLSDWYQDPSNNMYAFAQQWVDAGGLTVTSSRHTAGYVVVNTDTMESVAGPFDTADEAGAEMMRIAPVTGPFTEEVPLAVDSDPSYASPPGHSYSSRRTAAVDPNDLNSMVEFDSPFEVTSDGNVNTHLNGPYAPSVYEYEGDTEPTIEGSGWSFVDGYSGQSGYSGPVMHASEQLAGGIARDVLDNPGIYVVVEVQDPDDMNSPAGWALLKQGAIRRTAASGYGWVIDGDYISGRGEKSDVGTMGPSNISDDHVNRLKNGEGEQFTMHDSDGEHNYTGRIIDDTGGVNALAPLDDFGTPNAGSTDIKYKGRSASRRTAAVDEYGY